MYFNQDFINGNGVLLLNILSIMINQEFAIKFLLAIHNYFITTHILSYFMVALSSPIKLLLLLFVSATPFFTIV